MSTVRVCATRVGRRRHGSRSSSRVDARLLRYRKHVAVRILEPRDLRAARRGPQAAFILLHARISFERDALLVKLLYGLGDVTHVPAQNREWRGRETLHAGYVHDSNRDVAPLRCEDMREL